MRDTAVPISSRTSIVIPVFDAFEQVERCLASIARCRDGEEIVLVDDGSRDARIAPLLEAFAAANAGVRLVRQRNTGYVGAANAGAAAAQPDADLLFLNSDTELTQGALRELRHVAREHGASIVCPLTNNGSFLSVPRFMQPNALHEGWDAERMAAVVRACADKLAMGPVPLATAVGFCMHVSRATWTQCGPFDAAFGRGYGEEDDFAQRVRSRGGLVACAPRAYVWHHGGSSFSAAPSPNEARVANLRLLVSRWPRHREESLAFTRTNPLRPLQEQLWNHLLAGEAPRAAHVLHVLPRWEVRGPLRQGMDELFEGTRDVAIHTVVVPVPEGPAGLWIDAIDHESGTNFRVVGIPGFEEAFPAFAAASPATLMQVHGRGTHAQLAIATASSLGRAIIETDEASVDLAGCARRLRSFASGVAGTTPNRV